MKYLCMICGYEEYHWLAIVGHNPGHSRFIAAFADTADNTGFKPWGEQWLADNGRDS